MTLRLQGSRAAPGLLVCWRDPGTHFEGYSSSHIIALWIYLRCIGSWSACENPCAPRQETSSVLFCSSRMFGRRNVWASSSYSTHGDMHVFMRGGDGARQCAGWGRPVQVNSRAHIGMHGMHLSSS